MNLKYPHTLFIVISVVGIIIVLWGINALFMNMILREPDWKMVKNIQQQEEEQNLKHWQGYTNTEYGFSFQHPPMTNRTECSDNQCTLNVIFGTGNFRELVGVRTADAPTKRFYFGVLVKTDPMFMDLHTYVERQRQSISNVTRDYHRMGIGGTVDYVLKEVQVAGVNGYVIETTPYVTEYPRRRFFLPLKENQLLLLLEMYRSSDDILSTFIIDQNQE